MTSVYCCKTRNLTPFFVANGNGIIPLFPSIFPSRNQYAYMSLHILVHFLLTAIKWSEKSLSTLTLSINSILWSEYNSVKCLVGSAGRDYCFSENALPECHIEVVVALLSGFTMHSTYVMVSIISSPISTQQWAWSVLGWVNPDTQ